jgi:hypothetical protein
VFPDIASNLQTQAGFGSLNASTLASFAGSPPNVNLPAPIPRSSVSSTAGMSNRVTVTWDNPNPGRVSKYEVAVYRQGTTKVPTTVVRRGNIVSATFSSPHALTNGMYVNITSDEGFGGFNIPLISTSSSVVYYANSGPDYTATTGVGIAQVIEFTTVSVDGDKDSATLENLAAPGTTYSYHVTPYNEYGLAGETSAASTFSSSNEPFQLVASAVQSATYSAGSSGWRISADGTAEFNGGAFSVTSIDIGGFDESSFHVNTEGDMWLGASASASAPFRVTKAGAMTATSGTFSGAITGSTIDIGSGATSFHVDINGNMWSGAAAFANGAFRVSNTGALDIGGLDSSSFHVDKDGNMWIGDAAYVSAPFKVSNTGVLVASSGTIAGSIAMLSNGNLVTSQGLGSTTLGWNAAWSGSRSGIFSDGGPAGFASLTYGDISIQTSSTMLTTINNFGVHTRNSTFSFNNIQATRYHVGFSLREGSPGVANRLYANANDVAGDTCFWFVGAYTPNFSSDRRLKSNLRGVSQESLDKFYSIKTHEWDWNENAQGISTLGFLEDNPISIGPIADEIKEIYPHIVVSGDGESPHLKYDSIAYSSLVPQMICVIQDLNARIKELEARLGI